MEPDIYTEYQRLMKAKNGRAVAVVSYEQCMGCSMKIPAQIYNEVMLGEKIKFCPHCTRILLVNIEEGDPTQ
jgi:predicted  nucleic acid-binding Zn-ribbon protein